MSDSTTARPWNQSSSVAAMSGLPDDFRAESRRRWARSAPGWGARGDELRAASMPVSAWMVEAIHPQPGATVLELAAGTGDTGFLAAELIQPGGELICSDFVPEMLAAAQERARALGIRNVRFRQIDVETSIDQPAASLDAILCRWGYMLLADPVAALRETRRVLRPGGRVALAAWTGPEDNPWSALPGRALVQRGLLEPPPPGEPGQFAWAEPGLAAAALQDGGFTDVEVEAVDFTMDYRDVDDWWAAIEGTSMRFKDAAAGLAGAERDELRAELAGSAEPFVVGDGRLVFPARTWVAAATA